MRAFIRRFIAVFGLCCSTHLYADVVVLEDDFASNKGWNSYDNSKNVSFKDGKLITTGDHSDGSYYPVSHDINLSGAASYQVSLQLSVTKDGSKPDEDWLGFSLVSSWNDRVMVVLRPEAKNVRMFHRISGSWQVIMAWTYVDAMKSAFGEVNNIVLDSQAGRFTLFINGERVGSSMVINFAPSLIGLHGQSSSIAEYDNLKIVETGIDSHQARFLLLAKVPGQKTLSFDNFKRKSKGKAFFSKLISSDDEDNTEPDWGDLWDNENSRAELNLKRERLILESKNENAGFSLSLNANNPLTSAGVSVNAQLNFPSLGGDNQCAGVHIISTEGGDDDSDFIKACITRKQAKMVFFRAGREENGKVQDYQWFVLSVGDLAVLNPATADICLVVSAGDVVMFVDGKMLGASHIQDYFYFEEAGVVIDGNQLIEVTEFKAAEI
jgi:hypothetical protein